MSISNTLPHTTFITRLASRLLPSLLLGAALTTSATVAAANTLEGTLNGEPRSWHIVDRGGQSTANFSEITPGATSFTVQGHAETRYATKGTFSITFVQMNGQLLGEPEVSYFPEAKLFPNYSSAESGTLTLEQVTVDGDSAHLVGSYSGTLQRVEGIGRAGAADDTLEVDVRFDVQAQRSN